MNQADGDVDTELVFHLEGDDHESRTIVAATESEARTLCAEGFNSQYDDADYDGSEFDLRGVYKHDEDLFDDFDEEMDVRELVKVDRWAQ
ncbi:hypothetical protein MUG78_17735 [Gordonia alkaliphila]|uniref:hypothetical protein n=1 Tax=Gordonia alkaliphila TaxID=1053547 RepID=UPI001FF45A39|nr:hypothetical protein [Gordonia alkaliphila]MCK0441243.1 hypothetical protein [Gordonia alkaliphila]